MEHDFLTKFHQIEGETIGERQRNLNKFLKDVTLAPDEKQFLLDNLSPKTYLENVFYVDILIHYRETERLLEIFKDGNEVFVSKIMKQPWFFQEAFNDVTSKALADDFLPLLSFSIKIKLLKSLSHVYSEEKIDQVFDFVNSRYGLFLAETLITSCSSEKITNVLKNYKVKLSTHQLKRIYKKEPNLINIYLEEQKQYYKKSYIFEKNFLVYLAQQDPTYFWELTEKCQIDRKLKLGRRTTKKCIPTKTQEIVNNPQKYIEHLRHETLVRKLNKQGHFKQFYYNLFPRKTQALRFGGSVCNNILKYYPKSHRYNLFVTAFNEILNEDIWNCTSCIQDNFLDSIIDIKIREAWAQLKFKESGEEKYLKYFEIDKSIPLIKEKINTASSTKSRRDLISLLVECCATNKDLKSLEEVVKYFCVRHKNDDKSVRIQFMKTIESHCNLEEFTGTHWKYIIEILNIQSLNREYESRNSFFRIKHIEHLFNNNGSKEDKYFFVLEYIKELKQHCVMNFTAFKKTKNSEVQKTILLQIMENIETILKDADNIWFFKSELVAKICWFNSKYPEKSINIQDNHMLVEYLKSITKGGVQVAYTLKQNFHKLILKRNRNEFEKDLLNFYLGDKSFRQATFSSALQWFLKYDPMVIVKNFDVIMDTIPTEKYYFWNIVKQYNHISLDDKVIKLCLDQIENADDYYKPIFVRPLSIVGKPELYIKTIEDLNLIPTSSKIPVDDEDARDLFQIQKAFLENLQNVWNPLIYLPLLIDKFCQGDYLRTALTPLCVAFHKIPENRLEVHLDKLANNKAMSVKKHALHLARYMFPEKKVSQIFNSFQVDKNVSLQKCLCISSLRYFFKVQTRKDFERLVSYLTFLKSHDEESLELLSYVQIPKNYKPYYVQKFWNILEILKMDPNVVGFDRLMSTVLGDIDKECFSNLPEDFCKAIIKDYFCKSEDAERIENIFEFTINFLIMYHKNQTDNFNLVFLLLSNWKKQFFDLKTKEVVLINRFFRAFYNKVQASEVDLEFVIKFSTEWNKVFSAQDLFTEHVLLHLSILRNEANGNIELYSKNVVHFAEHVSAQYGEFIFSKFCSIAAGFCIVERDEKEIIGLLTEILKYKTSSLNCVLVMELLTAKGDLFDNYKIRPIYHEINSILKQITDPKVQLCYNLYIKNDSV